MTGQWAGSRRRAARSGSGWDEQASARRILTRDGRRCYFHGPDCIGHAAEVDHVRPFSQGGTDTDDNKRAICVPCHRAKTAREATIGRAAHARTRPAERHPGLLPTERGGGMTPLSGLGGPGSLAARCAYGFPRQAFG